MLDDIMLVYEKNFQRLDNLIALYESLSTRDAGRKNVSQLDLLRATVVLMHSTLEDFLRSLLAWKLPFADSEILNNISLVGTSLDGRKTKFELGQLVEFKEKTIQEVIDLSVSEYLETKSFSNTKEIAGSLKSIGVEITQEIQEKFTNLDQMIKRRHKIVHEADRNNIGGSGNHRIRSISVKQVKEWKSTVDKLSTLIVKQLAYG